jgi:hypothetical protein
VNAANVNIAMCSSRVALWAATFAFKPSQIGSGFWLLSPLRLADGGVVLVNPRLYCHHGELPAA